MVIRQNERDITKTISVKRGARIAVLCKFKGNDKTIFPLTENSTQGYLYTEMQIEQRNGDEYLISRSFDSRIIKKESFLNAYPLQNPYNE